MYDIFVYGFLSLSLSPYIHISIVCVCACACKSQRLTLVVFCHASLHFFFFNIFYYIISSITFPMLSQKSPIPSSPLPYPPIPIYFLALPFPCTGAYTVCVSNGPLFPVMAGRLGHLLIHMQLESRAPGTV
jgi:hypothetical protein